MTFNFLRDLCSILICTYHQGENDADKSGGGQRGPIWDPNDGIERHAWCVNGDAQAETISYDKRQRGQATHQLTLESAEEKKEPKNKIHGLEETSEQKERNERTNERENKKKSLNSAHRHLFCSAHAFLKTK